MRPVPPPLELPETCRAALFQPPEGLEDKVNPLPGIVHLDAEGEPVGLEFMFELSRDEVQVLKHEPYVTITFMGSALPPFALQTSYPEDDKYKNLDDHYHICTSNFTHEEQKFWQCDNPAHNPKDNGQRLRECLECFHSKEQDLLEKHADLLKTEGAESAE
jgi:hypothetical protein